MAVLIVVLLSIFGLSLQPKDAHDLRSALDNPAEPMQIANVEFLSNQDVGPYNRTDEVLAIKQRYYSKVGDDFLVHQLQLPVVYQPKPDENVNLLGWGDFDYKFLYSTTQIGSWKWGVGPAVEIPTGSDPQLGTQKWSAGAALSLVYQPWGMSLGGNLVQKWSFAGNGDRKDVNLTEVEPVVKIYIGHKTTLGLLDTIKVDWTRDSRNRWTIPVGAELGEYFKAKDFVPMNVRVGLFSNVVRPENSSDWYWRVSMEFVQ